ncbi:MAG: class I SAM-dependent methyltransferase [Opitutaceae bacterium]
MSSAERIKQVYERFPYPGNDLAALLRRGGSMPALKWMQGIGRTGCGAPRRVLVAGCGTGVEAFVLRRQLPKAEIVAVDFSPRSIAVARKLERMAKVGRPITFQVADLTDAKLAQKIGKDFDLITCHGVLSYIPEPARALRALATCLATGGALYLGVNGAGHPTTTLRPWLKSFGIDVSEMKEERRLRTLLQLWDALHDDDLGELSTMPTSYLAGDVCGAFFNNGSLAYWRTQVRRSGWDLAGTAILPPALRLVMEGGRERPLFPAKPGAVAVRLDAVRPAGFHRMMLRRMGSVERSQRWTGLYTVKYAGQTVQFFSATLGVRFEDKLSAPQLAALKLLVTKKGAPQSWEKFWTRSEAGRRMWWRWAGLGVVAA